MEDYKNERLSPKLRAESLLSKMTLNEKIGQLNQRLYGFSVYERRNVSGIKEEQLVLTEEFKDEVEKYSGLGTLYGLYRADPWSGRTNENGLVGNFALKAYNMVQNYVIEHSRLGIPAFISTECPHGHQAIGGYLLPVNLAMGATFDCRLVEKAYSVCGKQMREMGVDFALVSMLDVLRDPRWGRSEECYGEDPFLVSEFAKAAVKGIQSQGVYVVAKHFAAQGEGTGGINASAARIGERELREIHLPPMRACCEAKVKGVMAAYNEIDGIPCHANRWLLQKVLREEMGFDGIVMSDGVAIDQLNAMTNDTVKSGAKALRSGIQVGLWDEAFGRLDEALERGLITIEEIDKAVLAVLTMKFERGLFEHPYREITEKWQNYHYNEYTESLQLARESIILLKNEKKRSKNYTILEENKILPLDYTGLNSIAVIGPNADDIYCQLGDYTPPIEENDAVTILDGIKQYNKEHGNHLKVQHAKGCHLLEREESLLSKAKKIAKSSDIVLLVAGGSSSRFCSDNSLKFDLNGAAITKENSSMDCGEGVDTAILQLPDAQRELIKEVCAENKNVILLVIGGRPYAIEQEIELPNGVFYAFYPGIKGGKAMAEILFGKISPSGRLPVSIPRHAGQLPVYYNSKASYQSMNYYDLKHKPLYSFGFGLSYTTFKMDGIEWNKRNISIDEIKKEGVTLTFCIKNIGERGSFAVPMLFIRHKESSVIPRIKELKAFDKVWIPNKGRKKVTFHLSWEELSIWNESMKFIMETGIIELSLSESGEIIWKGDLNVFDTTAEENNENRRSL